MDNCQIGDLLDQWRPGVIMTKRKISKCRWSIYSLKKYMGIIFIGWRLAGHDGFSRVQSMITSRPKLLSLTTLILKAQNNVDYCYEINWTLELCRTTWSSNKSCSVNNRYVQRKHFIFRSIPFYNNKRHVQGINSQSESFKRGRGPNFSSRIYPICGKHRILPEIKNSTTWSSASFKISDYHRVIY